jgi:hypothetical protein
MNLIVNEAEKNGEEDGLLGTFDSKEEYEKSIAGIDFTEPLRNLENIKI